MMRSLRRRTSERRRYKVRVAERPIPGTGAAVDLDGVDVAIDGVPILHDIDWRISPGQRWVIVGPNGAGKTTLLRLVAGWIRPTAGRATIVGETIGRTDLRVLRRRIGYSSQALADLLRPSMTAHEVVLAARYAALETWWNSYTDAERAEADERLALFGIDERTAHRRLQTLSAGERQRVLLARAFAGDPGIVVLDEPTAGLDIGGREDLVTRLDRAASTTTAPLVLVTHHLEEIPAAFDRVLLIDDGRIVAAGPATEHLTSTSLSDLYGVALSVSNRDGRWQAIAAANDR